MFIALLLSIATILLAALIAPGGLIEMLSPILVFLVTLVIKKYVQNLPGWVIVTLIVPLVSAAISWVATLIIPDASWLQQFLLGLLGTVLREIFRQLSQIGQPGEATLNDVKLGKSSG